MSNQVSTCFVIFGVTGDLARSKLIPSLFDLYQRGYLPDKFSLIGYARRDLDDQGFKELVTEVLQSGGIEDRSAIDGFLSHAHYVSALFEDQTGYQQLARLIASVERQEFAECANKLFYLSVAPESYMTILDRISAAGLSVPCSDSEGWSRILVEKPFGHDSKTAKHLDQKLAELFKEEQIFRIDHYLAKEAMQNILTFRLANPIFAPVWDSQIIERIEVLMYEDNDLSSRGSFYEGVGALRDVGQNHLLQMLALIAMDRPADWGSQSIRDARCDLLDSIKPPAAEQLGDLVRRAQYSGYRQEPGVAPDSETETYFRIEARLDNQRWRQLPVLLESGKGLDRTEIMIRVFFRRDECVMLDAGQTYGGTNQLTFRIQPNEGIDLSFWFKQPGFNWRLEEQVLDFHYCDHSDPIPDAYERVLYDCIRGDQMLFASTGEVMAQWQFIESITDRWADQPLLTYNKGSAPAELKDL